MGEELTKAWSFEMSVITIACAEVTQVSWSFYREIRHQPTSSGIYRCFRQKLSAPLTAYIPCLESLLSIDLTEKVVENPEKLQPKPREKYPVWGSSNLLGDHFASQSKHNVRPTEWTSTTREDTNGSRIESNDGSEGGGTDFLVVGYAGNPSV